MSRLELRYRRLLRLLPPAYRAVREEGMVETFLLSMEQKEAEADAIAQLTAYPSLLEQLSVAGLALRLRLGGYQGPVRYQMQGGAVRWFVPAVLLIQAVWAASFLFSLLWTSGMVPGVAAWDDPSLGPDSFWSWLQANAGLLWIPAFVALVQGHRRAAQLFGVVATIPLAVRMITQTAQTVEFATAGQIFSIASGWILLIIDASVLLGLAAFHSEAPPLRPRPWLISAAVAIGVIGAGFLMPGIGVWLFVDDIGLWSDATVGGAVAIVVLRRNWNDRQRTQAYLGLCLLASATFVLRATTIAAFWIPHGLDFLPESAQISLIVQLLVVAVIAGIFGWLGGQQLRRMPSVTYSADARS